RLYMMKADVLSGFDTIQVCTTYKDADGILTDQMPYDLNDNTATPVYESFEGWSEDLTEISSYNDLPASLKSYVEFIERHVGLPIDIVSVGPDRKQTLLK
ncbi:adenylosuccinate synthetase, partial [Reichenbachiella sp.]